MPCKQWPILWNEQPTDVDAAVIAQARDAAQWLLWSMTGRRFGRCTTTEQLRGSGARLCGPTSGTVWRVRGWSCCGLVLSQSPVRQVTAVRIGGVVLDPSTYFVNEAGRLVRRDECWPTADECADAPIEVDYAYGHALPAGTALAMGEVASEFFKGWTTGKCGLPSRVISITRQGVNMQMQPPDEFVKRGRLGLPLADMLIGMTNPMGLIGSPQISSPEFGTVTP